MTIDYDRHLRLESERFLEAIRAADPDRRVPTCPDWAASDLLWHLTEVQGFWAHIVANRLRERIGPGELDRPGSPSELDASFLDAHHRLVHALAAADDSERVWTWYEPDQSVGFIRRRQAHEALVHRLDAEATADCEPSPIDTALATDGVDEALICMFSGAPSWARVTGHGPVGRLRTTDSEAEWWVRLASLDGTSPDTGTTYLDEPMLIMLGPDEADADHDFDVSASAADLVAWLWNRPATGPVVKEGDTGALEALVTAGVQ